MCFAEFIVTVCAFKSIRTTMRIITLTRRMYKKIKVYIHLDMNILFFQMM
jgi:hypothetical protein